MGAASIQKKIIDALKKSKIAVGSPTDLPIYLVRSTQAGTPLSPITTESTILLLDAQFKSYQQGLTDINIKAGDRQLVSNSDNEVRQNDAIRQGTDNYIVIAVDKRAPSGSPLVYISQVRLQ